MTTGSAGANDPEREAQTGRATQLMQRIAEGREPVIQPMHRLLEVGVVLARINPDGAEEDLAMLQALELGIDDDPLILRRACRLAIELQQHLFDTLYHAIVSLADWKPREDADLPMKPGRNDPCARAGRVSRPFDGPERPLDT